MLKFLDFAVSIAKEAGKLLMANHGKLQALEWKLRNNFKIQVDDESDVLIRQAIEKNFPDHNVYSEECTARERASEMTWVVDPLDGTIPYTHGFSDHFSVSIALVQGRTPLLGVIYAPKREELYVAEAGKGAFCNGASIRASNESDINHAVLGVDYGKINREEIIPIYQRFLAVDGATYLVSFGCASMALALVAGGKLHGYIAHKLEPWDMAAAAVINREAGARVTTIHGKEWELGDESIIVANANLHRKILDLLNVST